MIRRTFVLATERISFEAFQLKFDDRQINVSAHQPSHACYRTLEQFISGQTCLQHSWLKQNEQFSFERNLITWKLLPISRLRQTSVRDALDKWKKVVRGEVTAVGIMKSKQRRKEFMLIENYLIIPRISFRSRSDETRPLNYIKCSEHTLDDRVTTYASNSINISLSFMS